MKKWSYYNENDPFAAAWIRELMAEKLIPPGEVDERDIKSVSPGDVSGFIQCHWFAGISGWAYALRLAGWPDTRPVWTGSCPCQPFSAAGKRRGNADERHLWPVWFDLIRECRPDVVFGEQVEAAIRMGWLDGVRADLEGAHYALGATVLGAHSVGAPHIRQRLWWVADAERGSAERHRYEVAGASSGDQGAEEERQRIWNDAWDGGAVVRLADATELQRASGGNHGRSYSQGAHAIPESGNGGDDGISGFWSAAEWLACSDGKARRVESPLQSLVDGLPGSLEPLRPSSVEEIERAVTAHASALQATRHEIMRDLWRSLCAAAAGERPILPDEALLFAVLHQLAASGRRVAEGIPRESQEAAQGLLRKLWRQTEGPSCPPHRSRLEEQRPLEHSNAVHQLSLVLAPLARQAWQDALDRHASIVPPLASGVENRVGTLRGAGNAIVPQVAAEFIAAYLDVVGRQ